MCRMRPRRDKVERTLRRRNMRKTQRYERGEAKAEMVRP